MLEEPKDKGDSFLINTDLEKKKEILSLHGKYQIRWVKSNKVIETILLDITYSLLRLL